MRRCLTSAIASIAVALLSIGDAPAQDAAWVQVRTNVSEVSLYIDSTRVHALPSEIIATSAGTHRVRLLAANESAWSVAPLDTLVHLAAGDTTALDLALPHHYRVESIPYGATVYLQLDGAREQLGETPLTYTSEEPLTEGEFSIEKPGYVSHTLRPGSELWNRYSVMLEQMERATEGTMTAEVDWNPPRRFKSRWIDYGAIGLAIASAALSVHYKFKADGLYERYEDTGDPALRSRIEALDTRAAVALGAMQVGVGIFAIRLVLR